MNVYVWAAAPSEKTILWLAAVDLPHTVAMKMDFHLFCVATFKIICYLAGEDKIVALMKHNFFMLLSELPRHMKGEWLDLPHTMVMKVDVHSVCIASLK